MKKKFMSGSVRGCIALAVAAILAIGAVVLPTAQASDFEASYIDRLENVDVDYSKYLDGSKVFELADHISDDQEISVIITVDQPSLLDVYGEGKKDISFQDFALGSGEAAEIRQKIADDKARILSKLDEKGIRYQTGEDYDVVLSGFEIRIKAGDFKATCQSLSKGESAIVGEEYKVAETQLVENTVNVYGTGIFNSAGCGYDGTGMVVAVLDTGLDSNHTAFSVNNFTSTHLGLTYEEVAAVMGQTTAGKMLEGLSVDDVYINQKVPFGFDYADCDPDAYSTHNNHGTHVSGVIVGKDDTITGVAPNAQLVSMKVFSDIMDTARSTWILSALEDCVVLGVDVINMSLGTACGFSRENDEEKLNGVYDKIRQAGISMVVAASNSYSSAYGSEANGNLGLTSNPDIGTVGSPGTYEGVISVASINGVETPYILFGESIVYFDESTNGKAKENNFFETLLGDKESAEFEFVTIPGVGRSADYTGLDVTGKIALVRRGSNTFEEKAMIAQMQGAAGIIIYNNVSGDIKMNVGDATLAVCSISQDDGEMLAAAGSGILTISKEQTSGPFMSDFSSWGPTPSLTIKPEITAHGGNILSSITGGGYDRLSGTSMACPNLAGVVILLRQYVVENFPDIAHDNVAVNAMVNRLMMSTADIVINTNGLPYAVRKQGAGLANLNNSLKTKAYIKTFGQHGEIMDKTKLELGDDPQKTGVYTLDFTVVNFGTGTMTFDLGTYIMTEGISDTLTKDGETTVTEEAYLLSGASVAVSVGGKALDGTQITVDGGKELAVSVTITLSDADKQYMESFENGMYVEGFVTLTAVSGTEVNLSVPYLAFYGDWTQAPLFDLDYFQTNADELDDSVAFEDKVMPDAYATRPIGGVEGDYVSYLGSYYFLQDPTDRIISANRDYISLSNQQGAIHSLRYVWAGLLRSAQRVEVTITNDATGEVIFETVDTDVRKSYGDGGSYIYPANIEIEFDALDYNLMNNAQYTVTLVGYMDYGDGGLSTNKSNTFTFPLTIDFEAPAITDVRYYYEYDKSLKKNRLYAEVAIYDNHHAMSAQLGYVGTGEDEDGNPVAEMVSFEQYLTPVYSQRNSVTLVTYELTDYINEIKANSMNKNSFVVTCYDYAMNYATYEIGLPDDYVDFYFESLSEGLKLSPNEVYSLEPLVYPNESWSELLEYTSSRPSVVRVVNNKLVAVASGNATIKARDPLTNKSVTFKVTVLEEGDDGYRRYDKPVADVFRLDGYRTVKAYFMVSSEDKLIGDEGDVRFFEGNYSLELYPSESVRLNYTLDAYFPNETTVQFESSKDSVVKVDEFGTITAVGEGHASVTMKVLLDGRSTYYSETVSIEVKDPYVTTGSMLTHYYGNGGLVQIPADLDLTEIGAFAFSNYNYVEKSPEELAFDDAETMKQWFIGDNTISKVIIPEGVEKINAYAFANLTALEEVVLPSTLESIEYGAFYNCTALTKVTFSGKNNLKIINQNAFELCNLKSIDLSAVCIISDYAFAGNRELKKVTTSETLLSIGQYAFAGCEKLSDVKIVSNKVKYGPYAFTGCSALESFYVNAAVLPEGMFYQCENLKNVTIGPDVNEVGEFAFRESGVETLELSTDNKTFRVYDGKVLLSADGKTLVAVTPVISGEFTTDNLGGAQVTALANGAFSHNTRVTSVVLPNVTVLGDYAFGSCERLKSVKLGDLTHIGEYAFFETAITELPHFTADTVIGKYAFSYTDIVSVVIPDNMVIAEGLFSECLKLQSVTIGDNATIGAYGFFVTKDLVFTVDYYVEDGTRYYYYIFSSELKNVTIGDNAVIGDNAFANAASLESVKLGENATIGYMAFYNNASLKDIDLSKAQSIGDYAFSGDVYYICYDENMSVAAASKDGFYLYTYHAPKLVKADLSSATYVGKNAFSYCRDMTEVTLNDQLTEICEYAFAGCIKLERVNLSKVVTIGDYAFMETALVAADLSSAENVGQYAFVSCKSLVDLNLNPNGTSMGEGTFSYCEKLKDVKNFSAAQNIGNYAFAYTAIVEADLSGAVTLGDHVFIKETLTPFKVILGENLVSLGDNPFAMCKLEPFSTEGVVNFNGVDYTAPVYTYDVSATVKVINGSLYCQVPAGLELITFAGNNLADAHVADGTVRITSMAFSGSDVQMVTLPYTVKSLGHKAFFDCKKLSMVVFQSFEAPILEEEFDPTYYETYDHIPGTGDYGTYADYDGNEVQILGMGLNPWYMWNATGGMYSNVFYGANFVDYIGFVEDKLVMVRPANGQHYDTYILDMYFDLTVDGATAADDVTLAAIAAINAIPDRVTYENRAIVEAARAAYNKIATTEQQALVLNYADLVSAEQRIIQLTPGTGEEIPEDPEEPIKTIPWLIWLVIGLGIAVVAVVVLCERGKEAKQKKQAAAEAARNAEAAAASQETSEE